MYDNLTRTNLEFAYQKAEKRIEKLETENNKLLDVINNQDVKIADLEKENRTLEGCLLAEQEHTLMLEKQKEKMKSALIDIKTNTDDVNIERQIKYLFDELEIKENGI